MVQDTVKVESIQVGAKKHYGFGYRHLQVLLLFTGLMIAYALRVNLSLGIVAMVDNSENPEFISYDWNESTRSYILSSFFWGYIITQVPGGALAHKYGAKIILTISISVCSILAVFTKASADMGWYVLVANRVIQGLAQGFIYPSVHTMLSKWAPGNERGKLTTYSYAGTQVGTVLMMAVSGVLAASTMGWPSIYYVSGVCGIIWVLFWLIFGSNSPNEHGAISEKEREYIQDCDTSIMAKNEKRKTPWKQIFKSTPFLALLIVHCAQNWGFWILLTQIPSYIKYVLGLDIKSNALLSALPYLAMFIISLLISPISDYLMNKGYITRTVGRKIFNSIGFWIPMVALIGLGYCSKDTVVWAIVLLTIAVGTNAGTYCGFMANHMDLSPNYAGLLMGITNGIANILSILGPLFVGFIVTDQKNPVAWRFIFFITAGIYLVGNAMFVIFGSAVTQPWNENTDKEKSVGRSTDTNLTNV